jgi:hypothetical protein
VPIPGTPQAGRRTQQSLRLQKWRDGRHIRHGQPTAIHELRSHRLTGKNG